MPSRTHSSTARLRRSSVSVLAADATTADALATALCVLGPDEGLKLAERLPGVEVLFVYQEEGETRVRATPGARGWNSQP